MSACAAPPRFGFNLLTAAVLGVGGCYVGWFGAHAIARPEPRLLRRHRPKRPLRLPRATSSASSASWSGSASPTTRSPGCAATRRRCARRRRRASAATSASAPTTRSSASSTSAGIGLFFFIGGLNAMLIRFELLRPNAPGLPRRAQYLTLVGLHGTMMMGMMSSGILGPFANYFVPLMIGARRMAFPRIEALTFWLLMAAGAILTTTIFFGGFPTGWTGYAPLNDQANAGHGRVHRLLRARRHLDDAARPEHDRDDRDDARAGADVDAAADLRAGASSRPPC